MSKKITSTSPALPPRSVHWAVAFVERLQEPEFGDASSTTTLEVAPPLDRRSGATPPGTRSGEKPGRRFRTDRVFNSDGKWYISTREGIDIGPYWSVQEARANAAKLAKRLESVSREGREDVTLTIQQFLHRAR